MTFLLKLIIAKPNSDYWARSTKQSSRRTICIIWLFHRCQIFFKGTASFFIPKTKAQKPYRNYCKFKEIAGGKPGVLNISENWLRGWCEEYIVSLKHPKKRFSVSNDMRKRRIIQLLKNVWKTHYWYLKKYFDTNAKWDMRNKCFPLTYNLNGFKSRINRHLSFNCRFFLNIFPVGFNLCVLLFLVTPCLVVAAQLCMEWIPIK